jgi:hypothetical protein
MVWRATEQFSGEFGLVDRFREEVVGARLEALEYHFPF